ncbi:MAG TPA: UbiD family decarboxylase [Chloroflexi bacterium]|jgi:2,5-furandicarboxylate decarboxylase 1|nr:UbiD family decarboxylase [Chloroflexota bacterium]
MDVRGFLTAAEERGWLRHVTVTVDPHLELARVVHALGEEPMRFTSVKGWGGVVVAGLCSRRRHFALALGIEEQELMPALLAALRAPSVPQVVEVAPCQEVVIAGPDVDLGRLPLVTHFEGDGGPYVTAGVAVINDPDLGRNLSYHRLMRVGRRCFTARLVEGRGAHRAWRAVDGDLPMAVCIGAPLAVQLAAAMSPAPGVDEMAIANALHPVPTVRAVGSDLVVPAETEIVLEGRLTHDLGDEGPFVDLTQTRDTVRQQPFFVVDRITHRKDPIYQALLPGGDEHRLLMGMPREPTIYDAVSRVCACRDVVLTRGGGHWLHAVVRIDKRSPDDGRAAIMAAFQGHTSLKHVVVVDGEVDAADPHAVEWAVATRFQADRDLVVLHDQPSSSLDPSALHVPGEKARTTKMGLDATTPWDTPTGPSRPEDYAAVEYGAVDVADYLGDRREPDASDA